jgi:formylglycine-generating enzyme required for sulfatase activity
MIRATLLFAVLLFSATAVAQTTAELAEKASAALQQAESYEARVLADLWKALTPELQKQLDASETAWRDYRDQAVALFQKQYDGGTAAGLFATNLKTTLTEQRSAVLEAYFAEGYQGATASNSGEHEPGEVQVFDGIAFCWIPAGAFPMGAPALGEPNHDADRIHDEILHTVTISKGFWMGQYELTQGEWTAVMGSNPSQFKGDDRRPVENVSWNDAQAFIKKLNAQAGTEVYALPTEAQWEYACRAGTVTAFNTGDWVTPAQATVFVIADSRGPEQPAVVGSHPPNAWNLHDMHGNVEEWCQDWYGPYAEASQTDPKGPPTGEFRIQRGGAFMASETHARSAKRSGNPPGAKSYGSGFRLVRAAE